VIKLSKKKKKKKKERSISGKIWAKKPGVVRHACNPNTKLGIEAEAGV
jgi:hypothetical protein